MTNPIRIVDNTNVLHNIGEVVMSFEAYQNAFLNALVNRIGLTIITSRTWDNPWSVFKQGQLELGETVEEIFVNIANVHSYDPATAESEVYKREIPDVRAAFHTMNYQKFYKVTVQNDQLRQAFLSWSAITDLIAKITESLYTGMNYDEYIVMKYMCAREALNGNMYLVGVGDTDIVKTTTKLIRANASKLTFLKPTYNQAGVYTSSKYSDQYLIVDADYQAEMDVDELAVAFNMDKADFIGRVIAVDSWSDHDTTRLGELFGDDPDYTAFTTDDIAVLETMHAIQLDRRWWMVFDLLQQMTEQYNGEGLYWNYWLHVWRTFSTSPFANCIAYIEEVGAVSGVTVSPDSASMTPGTNMQFTATVAGTGIYDKGVVWSITGENSSTTLIDPSTGVLTIGTDEDAETVTVTATSVGNSTKTDSATVTIVTASEGEADGN